MTERVRAKVGGEKISETYTFDLTYAVQKVRTHRLKPLGRRLDRRKAFGGKEAARRLMQPSLTDLTTITKIADWLPTF